MSKNYFFDSYSIIELIRGNPNYEFVKEKIVITGVMNLAEVYYSLLLENQKETADSIIKKINFQFLDSNPEIVIESAFLRYRLKKLELSYVDCLGYVLALRNNLLFLTGDKEFENLENVEFVKK